MVTETIVVNTKSGFHLRPAGILSKKTKEFDCETTIIFNGNRIPAKNVMSIVAACIKSGNEIDVECDGPQEAECLQAIKELAENRFGESS